MSFTLPPPPPGWLSGPVPAVDELPTVEDVAWLDGYVHHLSASGIRLLKVCPEAWRNRYILGKKEKPGEALTLGTAVHTALAYTHLQKVDTHEDLPVETVVEFFHDKAWPDAVERDGGVEEIRWDKKPDEVRSDGVRVTAAYHVTVSPRIQPVKVEQKFSIAIPGIPVPVIGYIDVEEAGNSVDVKTGKQVTRKPDSNWRMQGTLYTAATGLPTHFHSVSRAKTPSIATPLESPEMIVSPHMMQREQIEKVLVDFAAQIEFYFNRYGPDETWPTTGLWQDYRGGPVCQYCGFRPTCPAWAWERVVVTP